MPDDRPRLGPWLRHYAAQEPERPRERVPEMLVAGAVAVGALVLMAAALLAFVRFPFPTVGALAAVWVVGYVVFRIKRDRAETRERELREELDRASRRP